jgi:hypothetical protein
LCQEYRDVFAESDLELGHTDVVKMKIDTGDSPPIRLRPYRTALKDRAFLEEYLTKQLEANLIRPSHSQWAFPLVIVPKKGGAKRVCVDFRRLNKVTKNYVWPMPHIDDILASLGESRYFTSLDLRAGYNQVAMAEEDKCKTAFACHKGLFESNVMHFGLSTAPSVFQELMGHVLEGLDFARAYLDDVILNSVTAKEHLVHIRCVFDRLRKYNLKLKASKCTFMSAQINYLGFIVGRDGVRVDPEKVEAIQELVPPRDVRGVRAFIGTCSYYRRFIPDFSKIATPLIGLIRKHATFGWTEA